MLVKDYIELRKAIESGEKEIELLNTMSSPYSIKLKEGQKLFSNKENVLLSFIDSDGVGITKGNDISNLNIQTPYDKRAIYIDSVEEDLGPVTLENLKVNGVVSLITRGENKNLDLKVNNLDIIAADARKYPEKPLKYGVAVHQGAFTLYNYNPKEGSKITASIENIKVGRENAPVLGSGIFISGFNDEKGPVEVSKLTTLDVYSNGMIPVGQPNLITGGIFIVYGAKALEIESLGKVVTYGTNDMVLDVWGSVNHWVLRDKGISYGPSGIGFVNFGTVDKFEALDKVETFGAGARGFNQYDGTVKEAFFDQVITHGDGSIGMQFSKPVGTITIDKEITTYGSVGETLVKGVIKNLHADAISVVEGGEIEHLVVNGDIKTLGNDVTSYHVNKGVVKEMTLKGRIVTEGEGSKDVVIEEGGSSDTKDISKYLS